MGDPMDAQFRASVTSKFGQPICSEHICMFNRDIGDLLVNVEVLPDPEGRVGYIRITSKRADILLQAARDKLGKPQKTAVSAVQNGFGAKMNSTQAFWHSKRHHCRIRAGLRHPGHWMPDRSFR